MSDDQPTGPRRVHVYGPAYLDRILRVDRPLLPPGRGNPLDRSVEGEVHAGDAGLTLIGPMGRTIQIDTPDGWPGPTGSVRLRAPLGEGLGTWHHHIVGQSWQDDLGGMGAGYATAFGGTLVSALGDPQERITQAVEGLFDRYRIRHRPVRIADRPADWTLLITSGPHGDKLPIGFRGCHEGWAVAETGDAPEDLCDIRVVAGLPNPLALRLLAAPGASVRFFAPAMRNMKGHPSIASFCQHVDFLSCNLGEWDTLELSERNEILRVVPLVAVTDGPNGAVVHFHSSTGSSPQRRHRQSAFPRTGPPSDTNRAGETFASTLLITLLESGWRPGPTAQDLIQAAALRAAAASALVLDRLDFGFPTPEEVDAALAAGQV